MADTTVVKGLAELNRFLDELPAKLAKNAVRGAMRAGAKAVLPVARANIRPVSGELAASLKVGSGVKGTAIRGTVYTRVFYARFVEYGTKPHTITASGHRAISFGGRFFQSVHHPGATKTRPFLRPALDAQKQQAVIAAAEYLKQRLETKHGLDTSDVEIGPGDDA